MTHLCSKPDTQSLNKCHKSRGRCMYEYTLHRYLPTCRICDKLCKYSVQFCQTCGSTSSITLLKCRVKMPLVHVRV